MSFYYRLFGRRSIICFSPRQSLWQKIHELSKREIRRVPRFRLGFSVSDGFWLGWFSLNRTHFLQLWRNETPNVPLERWWGREKVKQMEQISFRLREVDERSKGGCWSNVWEERRSTIVKSQKERKKKSLTTGSGTGPTKIKKIEWWEDENMCQMDGV